MPGNIAEPQRPTLIPAPAQWLGGIGEGAWYTLEAGPAANVFLVTKYSTNGSIDYQTYCQTDGAFTLSMPYQFTYHCHYRQHRIVQNNRQFLLKICNQTERYPQTA